MQILTLKYFSTIAIFFLWINNGILKLNAQPDSDPTESIDSTNAPSTQENVPDDTTNPTEIPAENNYSTDDPVDTEKTLPAGVQDIDINVVATIERNIRDELFLDCASAAAGNSVTEILWLKDYVFPLNFSNSSETDQKEWSIKIPSLRLDDTGNYTCVMTNETHGNFHLTFEIHVYDAPEMYIKPENTTLMVGDSKTFTCKSSSEIPSYMEWYPGVNLNEVSSMMDLTQDQYNNVRTNDENPQTFEIQNVTHTDQGWYSCLARNGLNTLNASFYLEVIDIDDTSGIAEIITGIIISVMIPLVIIIGLRKRGFILAFLVRKFYL